MGVQHGRPRERPRILDGRHLAPAIQDRETAALLALRIVLTYQRTSPPAPGTQTQYPLGCGDAGYGYLHLLDALSKGRSDHGDPVNDTAFDAEVAYTIDRGVPFDQGNNNWRLTVRFNDAESGCHNGDWGFRVVVATNAPPHPPIAWRPDGLPVGVITAFRLPKGAACCQLPVGDEDRAPCPSRCARLNADRCRFESLSHGQGRSLMNWTAAGEDDGRTTRRTRRSVASSSVPRRTNGRRRS